MQHNVFGTLQSSSFVTIPWNLRSKILGLQLLQSGNELHQNLLRQLWKDLTNLERHGHFSIKSTWIHHGRVRHEGLHNCELSALMHVVKFQPLQKHLAISHGNHRTPIDNRDRDVAALIIIETTATLLPFQSEIQVSQAAHGHNP